MQQSNVFVFAEQLLARRNASNGFWFYLTVKWHLQLLFLSVFVMAPLALWYVDMPMMAFATACFFAGAKIRDLRWYSVMAKQWPITSKFLDWEKVEAIANGTADP